MDGASETQTNRMDADTRTADRPGRQWPGRRLQQRRDMGDRQMVVAITETDPGPPSQQASEFAYCMQ